MKVLFSSSLFFVMIFTVGCTGLESNDKKLKVKKPDFEIDLSKYKTKYKEFEGKECEVENLTTNEKDTLFVLEGEHPETKKLVHAYYSLEKFETEDGVIENGAKMFYIKGTLALIQNIYDSENDGLFSVTKTSDIKDESSLYDRYVTVVSYDEKIGETVSKSGLLTSGQELSEVELEEKFRISNCLEVKKMIAQFPGTN